MRENLANWRLVDGYRVAITNCQIAVFWIKYLLFQLPFLYKYKNCRVQNNLKKIISMYYNLS